MGWTWDNATYAERGQMIRDHLWPCKGDVAELCSLFQLTEAGCKRILDGDHWRPEYDSDQ